MSKRKQTVAFIISKNYIQMQKLNCILKTLFNYEEITPREEKIKILHTSETKWSIRI